MLKYLEKSYSPISHLNNKLVDYMQFVTRKYSDHTEQMGNGYPLPFVEKYM